METSYVNSDGDMGEEHIISHSKQHDFLLDGEPEIIELTDTKISDKSQNLALKKAIDQGVKTEDEWKKYNEKLAPSRQKESYEDYVTSLSNNYAKNVKRQLDSGKLNHAKKDKGYQSLQAIERNHGLAVEGSLFYLGNVDDYEGKPQKELKKYREWEVHALTEFYHSETFQTLNQGVFRAEIHPDERGRTHLQTQKTNYHKNSRGRVEMATGACQKEALIKLYGSEEALNDRLDLLQAAHDQNDKNKKKGEVRTDSYYWGSIQDGLLGKIKHATSGKRRMRIPELCRIEQMHELQNIALETAKQDGIKYSVTNKYTTDGVHKTATAYTAEHKAHKKAQHVVNRTQHRAKGKARRVVRVAEIQADEIKNSTQATEKQLQQQQNELERLRIQNEASEKALTKREQYLEEREKSYQKRLKSLYRATRKTARDTVIEVLSKKFLKSVNDDPTDKIFSGLAKKVHDVGLAPSRDKKHEAVNGLINESADVTRDKVLKKEKDDGLEL